ncbi:lipopolysaccharide core heptose(II) kinase RfaY [Salmonella enterica]|uniref:Lipopolysaccharide core heptose(II) kinase RfaY n=2 Tax=Salmonella enterica TaxID=28901 RepID=A0A731TGS2_SALEE|nr:lipopolysaccharide core heptose(II) kinase RfaY [Salmonella enterica]EDO5297413.1 lipopolysaccharide core heptose(II) kinase RfaY [Salmonella enterica subsp. houtenae serovar 40:z4,z24:-]EDT6886152.1 lipopolysaccharide core heptose(II) kinase RfaY [Salmonella enterica subsp. enterica]QUZ23676.1 lipopolysaccharide core heptose(II) kinase RfaY [Salmonella enterica subsp. VII str. CFSAN000554]HAE4732399.1 lipopolysaccharide core heptose(II) kinase RfaY [Salmonella enterica subsp. VII serovar 40
MIIEKQVKNYTVFIKKDGEKYIDIFKDFLSYNHQVIKVFRNIEDTKVVLIDTDCGKYILKIFSPKVKKTERFLKSLVKGDYYEKLFRQTARVRHEGFEALNDFYLLAEIKTLRYVKTYVMLIEYIEGIELVDMPEISDEVREKIKRSIFFLHQHNMVSGDPHKGNFILQGNKIRIIDLSGKRPSRQRRAKDRIDLERHYGIKNDVKDIGFYLLIYKKKLRNFLRRIKGKEKR